MLAWAVFIGELLATILGYQTRIGTLTNDFNMLVAIAMVHSHEMIALGSNGVWSMELQAYSCSSQLSLVSSARATTSWRTDIKSR